jgi:uracil-DNA glycosylase family 4
VSPSRLGVLRQACLECKACALGQRPLVEVTPVFGRRADTMHAQTAEPVPENIRLVIVGEAPGPQENKTGRPFIGPAGAILDSLLTWARIDPGAVWITNAVACWPHEAGKGAALRTVPPDDASIAVCGDRHLGPQLEVFPKAIVLALGMSAARATLREGLAIGRLQQVLAVRHGESGLTRTYGGMAGHKTLVTYHPSYLARRGFKDGDRADGHEDAAVVLKAFVAARDLSGAGR